LFRREPELLDAHEQLAVGERGGVGRGTLDEPRRARIVLADEQIEVGVHRGVLLPVVESRRRLRPAPSECQPRGASIGIDYKSAPPRR